MSRDLLPRYQFGPRVDPRSIDESAFTGRRLLEGEEVTVWESEPVPADKAYVWGYGRDSRDAGDANYIYAEFVADVGATIRDAKVVVAVVDSTGEDTLAKTTLGPDAGQLADAKSDPRTERPIFPEHAPGASQDKKLQLRLLAGSDADGLTPGSGSDIAIGFGRVG